MNRFRHQATATTIAAALLLSSSAFASSHREAPGITERPKTDNTDVYAFRSYEPGRAGFVTIIANFQPLQAPYGGPNYFTMDPDAVYEIHIDNDGDAVENLTYQFKFQNMLRNGTGITVNVGGVQQPIALRQGGQITGPDSATLGEIESYTLTQITGLRRTGTRASVVNASGGGVIFRKPVDNIGQKTIPDYPGYARQFIYSANFPGCGTPGRVFVGQRAEAFAVNLGPAFDLINFVPVDGTAFPGGIMQDRANDDLVGEFNVTSIAVEVPIACIRGAAGNGTVGIWSTASLPKSETLKTNPTYESPATSSGALVQVSRLGMPLVNELVIGLPQKNLFNAASPTQDVALASYVTNPTFPELVNILFRDAINGTLGTSFPTIAPTNFPRNDLVAAFLTGFSGLNQLARVTPSEMIRLNTTIDPTPRATQKNLGVIEGDLAGFPNGRRPGDDALDIVLRVAMGRLCHPIPLGGVPTDLGLCTPAQAVVGTAPLTDGAPISAAELQNAFPYLNDPIPGSPRS